MVYYLGMSNSGTFVDHNTVFLFQISNQRGSCKVRLVIWIAVKKERAQTVIACSFKNLHALFYCGPRKPVIIRRIDSWQDGDVNTERLRSKFPGFTYSLSKGLW